MAEALRGRSREIGVGAWLVLGTLLVPLLLTRVLDVQAAYVASIACSAAALLTAFWWRPTPTLLYFALLSLLVGTTERYVGSGVRQVDEVVIVGLVAISLIRRRPNLAHRINIVRDGAVVSLIAIAILSSAANGVPLRLSAPGLLLLLKGLAFFYVVLMEDVTEAAIRWAGRVIVGFAVIVAIGAAIELVAPTVLENLGLAPSARPRGTLPSLKSIFFHPVLFAWFASFVAIYLYTGFVVTRRWWMLAFAALLSLGTILAARRRAIIALCAAVAAGVGFQIARAPRRPTQALRDWSMPIASLVLLVGLFQSGLEGLWVQTLDRFGASEPSPSIAASAAPTGPTDPDLDPPSDGTADTSTPARLALLRASFDIATDNFPLGAGLGRFGSWMSRVEYSPLYVEYGLSKIYGLRPANPKFATDTFWPQIIGELGWLGLLAYGIFLANVAIGLWRVATRKDLSARVAILCTGGGLVFVQTLTESLANPIFHGASAYLVFGAMAAALATATRAARPAPAATELARR